MPRPPQHLGVGTGLESIAFTRSATIGVVLEEAGASEDPEGDGDIEFDDSETADDYYMARGAGPCAEND